jgi:hypothetical protein
VDGAVGDSEAAGDAFPRVHANAMAAHGGPFDISLDFGYRAEPEDDAEVQVRVTMSWEHASAMVKVLQSLVDGYQEQVGQLPNLERLREITE